MVTAPPARADRPEPLAARIAAALDRLARAQRQHRQHVATRHRLTPLQIDLLTAIDDGPPPEPSVGALATEVSVTQPTTTDSLRALATKGLVERQRDPDNARRAAYRLTDAGRTLVADLRHADDALTARIAELPAEVQATTYDALLTLIAQLADAGVITVARTCLTCRFHRLDGDVHSCTLLGTELATDELRINCPEHQVA